jgi:predicted helicase
MLPVEAVERYARGLQQKLATGHAAEHAYRPGLEQLMEQLAPIDAVNDPKRSEHGAPDFVFLQRGSTTLIRGWAETKDVTSDLDKAEKTEQLQRYAGYPHLFLTNYIEFRFYENGRRYDTVAIGSMSNGGLTVLHDQFGPLADALTDFLTKTPESITSGVRLSEVMGAKARRIRHNVDRYLSIDTEKNDELLRIFALIKTVLVHDLDYARFADMYAQTLVYGLFAARYNDDTPESFSRSEARDLVPPSNPFLREFFDHIAGARFDPRLAFIVDELCEIFAVSDVHGIVNDRLDSASDESDDKDPIIHFYEDFLEAYDPVLRKKMGVYFTPLPVVRFMVRTVDKLLSRDFNLSNGLANTSKTISTVIKQEKRVKVEFHKVQILDPATGTATFLNEIVKFVRAGFEGQQGRWPTYAREDLIPRLHGFELMMAPYTVAHLKLGLTLQESGVKDFGRRLGVYLTNSLEEGINVPQSLFHFGLAEAVAQEALQAGEVKTERPIMVVIGNPPYAGVSSNETDWANALIERYKVEPGGQTKLKERKHWLNDDYVKFIAFSEQMIEKTGSGIVAMITNHGYLDNPTFRGMRWRLAQTFDTIYVLNLHGNAKKKEIAPDGSNDENVFHIQQGVAIMFGVRTGQKKKGQLAKVWSADLWGSRQTKFSLLNADDVEWHAVEPTRPMYYFARRETKGEDEYMAGVRISELFTSYGLGIVTGRDALTMDFGQVSLLKRIEEFARLDAEAARSRFSLGKDSSTWKVSWAQASIAEGVDASQIQRMAYRPFDTRFIYYVEGSSGLIVRPSVKTMRHFIDHDNLGLVVPRMMKEEPGAFVTDSIIAHKLFSAYDSNSVFPLYVYADDGTRSTNLAPGELAKLTANISEPYEPEDVLDYIYGVLYSLDYREKYKTFLKTDFPRVPAPIGDAEFRKFIGFGTQLRELHLMTSSICDNLITTYPVAGSDEIEKLRFEEGKVWINAQQYFGGVPEVAWSFFIGGYQPAQKWLKDRKGKKLSSNGIEHYQKIITVLAKTDEIMHEIDA